MIKEAQGLFIRTNRNQHQSTSVINYRLNRVIFSILQNTVAKRAMQYRGNAQHDAQEFLLWLLDRVHEDLNNTGHNRPSIKVRRAVVHLFS